MMREDRAPPPASTCPACKSPVSPGDRFCEICGERIPPPPDQPPVCRSCGTPLLPGARFCENCGDPVKKGEEPPVQAPVVPVAAPAPDDLPEPGPVARPAAAPVISEEPVSAPEIDNGLWEDEPAPEEEIPVQEPGEEGSGGDTGAIPEEEPEEEPDEEPEAESEEEAEEEEPGPEPEEEKPEPYDGPVDELLLGLEPEEPVSPGPVKPERSAARPAAPAKQPPAGAAAKKRRPPLPKKTILLIAGLIVAIIVIAGAILVAMPMLERSGGLLPHAVAPPVTVVTTATPAETPVPSPSATPEVTAPPAVAATVPAAVTTTTAGDVPGAEQALPPQYTLYFEVDKNAVTGEVTVTATGPSRNVVKDITVKLTRADGEIVTDHLLPSQGMTDVTLAGTQNPERVEVTVLFYSGEQYRVIDRIVSYSRWK